MHIPSDILSEIIEQLKAHSEPFYIYDTSQIRAQCRSFVNIPYQNKSVHFATMANVNPEFLRLVKREGLKVFVNSVSHMNVASEAGYKGDEIIFTASALSDKTMSLIHEAGAQTFLDSPMQLKRWQNLFPGQGVGLRVNIGDSVAPISTHAGYFIGKESRLGLTPDELNLIENKDLIKGLHLYVGTDIFDVGYFESCYKELMDLATLFPAIECLNFGGGFGVAEKSERTFDLQAYSAMLSELMNVFSVRMGRSIKLILEPGRIIGGEAGYFVSVVNDVKERGEQRLVGLNASTVQFPRPLMYPEEAKHPVAVIRDGQQLSGDALFETTVYGYSTYSRDVFSRKIMLPEIKLGDVVVYGNAGAYSASSYSSFLGFERAGEVFFK